MPTEVAENVTEIKEILPIETAWCSIPNPDHPHYNADRAVAEEFMKGETGLIAALDGVGSGAENSEEAAIIASYHLYGIETLLTRMPTKKEAESLLRNAITDAGKEIGKLQRDTFNDQVDTTVSAGMLCHEPTPKDPDQRFFVYANMGDSRIYLYKPGKGEVSQLTTDHSLVQDWVDRGTISEDEAFNHPDRNIINRTVGDISKGKEIDFGFVAVEDGDVFIAVTDGVSDNIPPRDLTDVIMNLYTEAFEPVRGTVDLPKFTANLAEKAKTMMKTPSEYAKKDDITVATLRVPRLRKR